MTDIIMIQDIINLKGGSVDEFCQYALSKGVTIPHESNYILSESELKVIDPLMINVLSMSNHNSIAYKDTTNYISLRKAAKELNIGISTIIEVFQRYGIKVESNPNVRITKEQFLFLIEIFKSLQSVPNVHNDEVFNSRADNQCFKIVGKIDLAKIKSTSNVVNTQITKNNRQLKKSIIGIVKFFDHYKGFGYVVTNGCYFDNKSYYNGELINKKITTKSCLGDEPNDNDWILFDIVNGEAINVKRLEYNRNTLKSALKYRGAFAKIEGEDSYSNKVYNHSVLSHFFKHCDPKETVDIITTFIDTLLRTDEKNVNSIIDEYCYDRDFLISFIVLLYNSNVAFEDNAHIKMSNKIKKVFINSVFYNANLELLYELPDKFDYSECSKNICAILVNELNTNPIRTKNWLNNHYQSIIFSELDNTDPNTIPLRLYLVKLLSNNNYITELEIKWDIVCTFLKSKDLQIAFDYCCCFFDSKDEAFIHNFPLDRLFENISIAKFINYLLVNQDYKFNSLVNQLFKIISNNRQLLSELPLDFLYKRLSENEFVEIIKGKIDFLILDFQKLDTNQSLSVRNIFNQLLFIVGDKQSKLIDAILAKFVENESNALRLLLYKNGCITIIDENFVISCQDKFSQDEIFNYIQSDIVRLEQKYKISVSYMKYLYDKNDILDMKKIQSYIEDNFTDNYDKWENEWLSSLTDEDQYNLWIDDREIIKQDYCNYLFNTLLNDDIRNYDALFTIKRLRKERILDGLLDNLSKIEEIDNLPTFNKVYYHISSIIKVDVNSAISIQNLNNSVFNVLLWYFDKTESFDFETLRTKFIYFKPSYQVRIVKKLFMLAETNKMTLTIEMLDSLVRIDRNLFEIIAKEKPDIPIDISVDVIIKSLSKYVKEHKFFYTNEIFDLMLMYMKMSKKYDFKIKEFFDKCTGRVDCVETTNNIPYITGKIITKNNNYEITIFSKKEIGQQNGFFDRIKDEIRKLHNRFWNGELKVWQAPIEDCNTTEIMRIAQTYNMQIDNQVVKNQLNDINTEYEYITCENANKVYCEGRQNDTKWKNGETFYWCRNSRCFKNAIKNHTTLEWEKYTMFDFLRILGINTDNVDKKQSTVEYGNYIAFVSIINRINELLEHLTCKTCGELLEPVEITDFASQLVTHFKCTNMNYNNEKCPEYGNVYYIHNCFNWKCKSIIDQRETTKCPNGWYICKECGSCCSTANAENMINRQQERNPNATYNNLLHFVQNRLGHVENNEFYCYKCGQLTSRKQNSNVFVCSNCKIKYDRWQYDFNITK